MKKENLEVNGERWLSLEDYPNEVWKDIEGYEDIYQVSSLGRVKSLKRNISFENNRKRKIKERILKVSLNNYGYPYVELCKCGIGKTICVHIIVAKTFLGNSENKPTVNHKNGVKIDNRVENLEFATHSEQIFHAYKQHLREKPYGNKNNMYRKYGAKHHRSKPVLQYSLDGVFIKEWENTYEIVRKLKYTQSSINKCCLEERNSYKGYIWKYKKE